jgi:hypothetical protein
VVACILAVIILMFPVTLDYSQIWHQQTPILLGDAAFRLADYSEARSEARCALIDVKVRGGVASSPMANLANAKKIVK